MLAANVRAAPVVRRARSRLADVFDDSYLREQTDRSHPLSMQMHFRFGRLALLRVGFALNAFSTSPEVVRRLRNPREYDACTAELDFGLFVAVSADEVQHEPLAPTRGPDFIARWGVQRLAFEVKHPGLSSDMQAAQRGAVAISGALRATASKLTAVTGWGVEPTVKYECLVDAGRDASKKTAISRRFCAALADWSQHPKKCSVGIDRELAVSFVRRDGPGVSVWGPGFLVMQTARRSAWYKSMLRALQHSSARHACQDSWCSHGRVAA